MGVCMCVCMRYTCAYSCVHVHGCIHGSIYICKMCVSAHAVCICGVSLCIGVCMGVDMDRYVT